MRMSPLLKLVLVAVVALLSMNTEARLHIDSDMNMSSSSSPSSSSSSSLSLSSSSLSSPLLRFRTDDPSDEQVIAGMEASLLSLLGFTKRPKPQGSAYIPESLKKLYDRQNSIGSADIAKPGIHTRSANTVRSFSHVGE
jgi:bone morphogenetic protein 2/4